MRESEFFSGGMTPRAVKRTGFHNLNGSMSSEFTTPRVVASSVAIPERVGNPPLYLG